MTALQLEMLAGAAIALGVLMVARALAPSTPDLGSAFRAMAPAPTVAGPGPGDLQSRVGLWVTTHSPALARARVSDRDFAILAVNAITHTGRKLLAGTYGLAFPMLANVALAAVGLPLPWALPAVAGLATGVLFFTIPDGALRDRAAAARLDFARALVSYIDLVGLERRSGSGTAAAMESAAATADNWVFLRLRAALGTARYAGVAPWDSLGLLAADIGVPQLDDVANIMRLAGEESTSVADALTARSEALRNQLAEDEHAAANAAGERMWIPGSLLVVIYLILLAGPGVMRVIGG